MMGIIAKIEQWLQGKKTYLVVVSALLGAVIAYLNGDLSLVQALQTIAAALGFGALRSGVSKSGTGK